MDPTAADKAIRPVLAQDLKKLRVPGKVSAALWTVREDRCTLQVVLRSPGDQGRLVAARGARNSRPMIDLWLLAPEGTIVPPLSRWDSPDLSGKGLVVRAQGPEVNFQFPREAGRQGVTAVLTVDGEVFSEPIRRMDD